VARAALLAVAQKRDSVAANRQPDGGCIAIDKL